MAEKKYKDEYVLVFPAPMLRELGYFNGICFEPERYLEKILHPDNHEYMNRNHAEDDPGFKQLIPYLILTVNGTFYSYRRGKLMGEKRLLGNRSIGIGGHISVDDPGLFGTTYDEGMKRELAEEVEIDPGFSEQRVALINDDSNAVGSVHFGVVHLVELHSSLVRAREKSINEAGLVSPEELRNQRGEYETWSQICIDALPDIMDSVKQR